MDKSKQLDNLVADVEALLGRLPNDGNPESAAFRDRVDQVILDTWTAVAHARAERRQRVNALLKSFDDGIRVQPWLVIAAAAAIAGLGCFAIGGVVNSRRARRCP